MKMKEINSMSKKEKEKKLKELDRELMKLKVNATKSGGSKIKEAKKVIARIKTSLNVKSSNKKESSDSSKINPPKK